MCNRILLVGIVQFFMGSNYCLGKPITPWRASSYKQTLEESNSKSKNIILFWTATWCNPCMLFKDQVLRKSEVQKALSDFIPIYLDADAESTTEWFNKYQITSYPTIMVLNQDGHLIEKMFAGIESKEFIQVLNKIAQNNHVKGNAAIIDSVLSGKTQNLSSSDVGRVLSYGWCYSKDKGLFNSLDQKIDFFRSLNQNASSWNQEISDRVFYQYLYLLSITKHKISNLERNHSLNQLNGILDSNSRLVNLVWNLPFNILSLLSYLKMPHKIDFYLSKLKFQALNSNMSKFNKVVIWKSLEDSKLTISSDDLIKIKGLMQSVFEKSRESPKRVLEIKTISELAIQLRLFDQAQKYIESMISDPIYGPIFMDLKAYKHEIQGNSQAMRWYIQSAITERGWMSKLMRTKKVIEFSSKTPGSENDLAPFLYKIFNSLSESNDSVLFKVLNSTLKLIYSLPNGLNLSKSIVQKLDQKTKLNRSISTALQNHTQIKIEDKNKHFSPKIGIIKHSDKNLLVLQIETDINWKILSRLPNNERGLEFYSVIKGKKTTFKTLRNPPLERKVVNNNPVEIYPQKYQIIYDFDLIESSEIPIEFIVKATLCNDICKQETISILGKTVFKNGSLDLELKDSKFAISPFEKNRIPKLEKVKSSWTTSNLIDPIIFMMFLAVLGGFILNGMPCVLPVVILKVRSLANWRTNPTLQIRKLSLSYCTGILFTLILFAIITFILKSLGHAVGWGLHFQSPHFLFFTLVIMFILTLSMFGLIYAPISLSSTVIDKSFSNQYLTEFFNGIIATILATPCTAPFLGTAVVYGIGSGSFIKIFAIFIGIGLGLGLPFWLLVAFPALVTKFPKPGKWMEILKYTSANLMLVSCAWIFDSLVSIQIAGENIFFISLSLIAIFTAIHSKKWLKNYWIFLLIALSFSAITVAKLHQTNNREKIVWNQWSPKVAQESIAKNELILINVTASWCITCKWNEQTVFCSHEFNELAKKYNVKLYKADYTESNPKIGRFLSKYDKAGVPAYILLNHRHESKDLGEVLTVNKVAEAIRDFSK